MTSLWRVERKVFGSKFECVMDERWIWLFYSADAWFKIFKALEVMEFNFSL